MLFVKRIPKLLLLTILLLHFLFSLGAAFNDCQDYNEGERELVITRSSYQDEGSYYELLQSGDKYRLICGESFSEYESVDEAIESLPDGAVLHFSQVSAPSFSVQKSISLSGTLEITEGDLVLSFGDISFSDLSLELVSGSVSVESAYLRVNSGGVHSGAADAVRLDSFGDGTVSIFGGSVMSDFGYGIRAEMGTLGIFGGEVKSKNTAAVLTNTTLRLCAGPKLIGFDYDIITSRPIQLSQGVDEFSGEIRVKYMSEFEKGTSTVVLLGASASHLDALTLFDKNGEVCNISYFDSIEGVGQRNFIAVHLPNIAKFYLGDEIYATLEFLNGNSPARPDSPEKPGYSFVCWCSDFTLGTPYDFNEKPSGDISLFSKFSLLPPSFSLSSINAVYNATPYTLALDSLTHPLAEQGSFSYEWYRDNIAMNIITPEIKITNVKDSGIYKCKLTFSYNGDYVTVFTPDVSVNIEKIVLDVPNFDAALYTGEHLNIPDTQSSLYDIDSSGGTDAGEYPVYITLRDTDNYIFETGTVICESSFRILQANNEFLSPPTHGDYYVGFYQRRNVSAKFGTVEIYYSTDGIAWGTAVPNVVGRYYAKFCVSATPNYSFLESDAVSFSVLDEYCIGISLQNPPNKLSYIAFDTLDLSGIEVIASYNSGRSVKVPIELLSVEYRNQASLSVLDSTVSISYLGYILPISISVVPREYDLSAIDFSDKEVSFSGKRHTITPEGSVVGLDGIELKMLSRGGGTDVGSYEIVIEFSTDSINYKLPEAIRARLSVLPLECEPIYTALTFVYDGGVKRPIGYYLDIVGNKIPLSVLGGGIDVGNYFAKSTCTDKNYLIKNQDVSFNITPAIYDMSCAYWSSESFVYDGNTHSVTLLGLPSGVSAIGYVDASASSAGEYVAVATLHYDTKNYYPIETPRLNWQILRADYDMSGIVFSDSVFIYDGLWHTPNVSGDMPIGADGTSPEYSFSDAFCDVTEGDVTVVVSFRTDSKNYRPPQQLSLSLRIDPRPIEVRWYDTVFVYSGDMKCPGAVADEAEITVSGGGVNAGRYIAECISNDKNYIPQNPRIEFIIEKAQNKWLTEPGLLDFFESQKPSPLGEAKFGETGFRYFNESDVEIILDFAPGRYYMIAAVAEGENYLSITSDKIFFDVEEVLPLSLSATAKLEYYTAFNCISVDDVDIFLINNDASLTQIPLHLCNVVYQNGTSLRFGDSAVEISYLDFSYTMPIKTERAKYDMSEAFWQNTVYTYDGTAKYSTLGGLAGGVTVSEYLLNSATEAGRYELSARLDFDSDNYYPPQLPTGFLIIEKCKVPYPGQKSVIYDGEEKHLKIESTELYSGAAVCGVNVGRYEARLTLTDPANYEFEDGKSSVYLTIMPRDITIRVNRDGKSYSIVSGNIIKNDKLEGEYYKNGQNVYVSIQNPNYSVDVIPYTINPINENLWIILLSVLIFSLIFIILTVLLTRKEELLAFAGGIRDKYFKSHKSVHGKTEPLEDDRCTISESLLAVDEIYADSLITDNMAKSLLSRTESEIVTFGRGRCEINVGDISSHFSYGDIVDINSMKSHGLIPKSAGYVKVLGGGIIDKPLKIYADSFSLSAVKMIALTGGGAIRCKTIKRRM